MCSAKLLFKSKGKIKIFSGPPFPPKKKNNNRRLAKFLKCVYFRKKQKIYPMGSQRCKMIGAQEPLRSPFKPNSPASLENLLSGLWGEVHDSSPAHLLFRAWTRNPSAATFSEGASPWCSQKGKQGTEKCEDLWYNALPRSHEKTDCSGGISSGDTARKIHASVCCTRWGTFLSAWCLSSPASHWPGLPGAEVTPLHFWVTALSCSESHILCFMYQFIQVTDIEMWRCQSSLVNEV